jgi:hypothetical protein
MTLASHDCDAIFLAVDGPEDMRRLSELRTSIKPNGAVWAVFRKGQKHSTRTTCCAWA